MNIRKSNGITLVVLIITVIVMLILSGVGVYTAFNGDGIFDKSSKIKIENNKKLLEEKLEIAKQRAEIYENKSILDLLKDENIKITELDNNVFIAEISNDNFLVENYSLITYMPNAPWKGLTDVAEGFDSGTGTESDPYIIRTASQLAYLSKRVNEGESFEGKYFRQVETIDLGARPNGTTWTGSIWIPIGYAEESPFSGTYDGQNNQIVGMYSVKNIKLYDGTTKKTLDYIGLFGVNTGTIKNLDMSGNHVGTSNNKGGMIAGYNKGGTIENCVNKSECVAGAYDIIGSICGINENGVIRNCHNEADLKGASGIVGANNAGTIEYCYNKGDINPGGFNGWAGIAFNNIGGTIEYCYNEGKIVNGARMVVTNKENATIRNCYNKGYITKNSNGCAGISIYNNSGSLIEKCYNSGVIECTAGYVGSVVGNNSGGIVKNCYNTAKVSGGYPFSGDFNNGLGNAATNCYNIGEVVANGTSDKTYYIYTPDKTKVTEEQLKSEDILTILNSEGEDVWRIDPNKNNGMPILDWQ